MASSALALGALVQCVAVPAYWDDPRIVAIGSMVAALALLGALAGALREMPHWRTVAAVALVATAFVFALWVNLRWISDDLAFSLAASVELVAGLLLLVHALPGREAVWRSWGRRFVVLSVATASLLAGATIVSGGAMAFGSPSPPKSPVDQPLAFVSAIQPIRWPPVFDTGSATPTLVTPHCTTEPTAVQWHAARSLVRATAAALGKFENIATAKALGYVPFEPSPLFVHYINWRYVNDDPETLDLSAIQSLLYVHLLGRWTLVGAMYMMRDDQVGELPPMVGGCLTEWHIHLEVCWSAHTGIGFGHEVGGTCPSGTVAHISQPMLHVWVIPVPGGPLAPNVTDDQLLDATASWLREHPSLP